MAIALINSAIFFFLIFNNLRKGNFQNIFDIKYLTR